MYVHIHDFRDGADAQWFVPFILAFQVLCLKIKDDYGILLFRVLFEKILPVCLVERKVRSLF